MSRARRPPSKASVSAVCGDTTLLSAPLRAGVMDAGATEAGWGVVWAEGPEAVGAEDMIGASRSAAMLSMGGSRAWASWDTSEGGWCMSARVVFTCCCYLIAHLSKVEQLFAAGALTNATSVHIREEKDWSVIAENGCVVMAMAAKPVSLDRTS
eukprot:1143391-Pelagomonas_calceolata.AAC.9